MQFSVTRCYKQRMVQANTPHVAGLYVEWIGSTLNHPKYILHIRGWWIGFTPTESPPFVGSWWATNRSQQHKLFIWINRLFNCTKGNGKREVLDKELWRLQAWMWEIAEGCIDVNRFKVNYDAQWKNNVICSAISGWNHWPGNILSAMSLLKETWMLICIGSIKTCSCLPSILDGFTSLNPCSQSWAAQNRLVNCDYVPVTD